MRGETKPGFASLTRRWSYFKCKGRGGARGVQRQKQVPPLRSWMTSKGGGNGKSKGKN